MPQFQVRSAPNRAAFVPASSRPLALRAGAAVSLAVFLGVFAVGSAYAANPKCAKAQATFSDKCSMCHGADGKGYSAIHTPDFTSEKWQAAHKDAELADAITNGKQGDGMMPPFKDQLSAGEIDALVTCVVRGFGKPAAAK